MPRYYQLNNPAITSLSVEGVEHKVDPDTGLLVVEILTPGLLRDLEVERHATKVDEKDLDIYRKQVREQKEAQEAAERAATEANKVRRTPKEQPPKEG